MNKEDIPFLNQLIQALEESVENLEKAYDRMDYDKFNKSKKIMLKIQNEISDRIK